MIILPFHDSNRAFVTVVMTTQITFKGGGGGTQKWKIARNKKNKLAVNDGIKIYRKVKDGKKQVDTYI